MEIARSNLIKVVLILSMALLAGSCGTGSNRVQIAHAGLYADPAGENPTTQYGWLDPFYLIIDFSETPQDAEIRVSWITLDTARFAPETVLKIDERLLNQDQALFELTNQGFTWPTGEYQVNIYQNGKLIQDLKFEVLRSEDLY